MKLKAIYPVSFHDFGVSHACFSITSSMASENMSTSVIGSSIQYNIKSKHLKTLIPMCLNRIIYKVVPSSTLIYLTELFFYYTIKKGDIAYLWPGTSTKLFKKMKDKQCIIVAENINGHTATSVVLLDLEYHHLNLLPTHSISTSLIQDEKIKSSYCDYIFSPSPSVTKSLLDNGIDRHKILQSSYGLSKSDQLDISSREYSDSKPITAIFVGRIGVRKGIHLLLEYWDKADVNGILKVIGNIEEPVKEIVAHYQNHPKIEFINFVSDLKTIYKEADMFLLPSIEEGSPLVTYLALGAGLPCIVSPMGSGGIINDKKEGFVINPHDEEKWVSAIQKLANDHTLRKSQSLAAYKLSNYYLWEKVGQRRTIMLMNKIKN